jgi:predicted ATPase
MANGLDKMTIKGFKSIRSLEDFELTSLNVLIGGNGAGKSNFVEIFRILRAMVDEDFSGYVMSHGGCDDYLFNGPKTTPQVEAKFIFGHNSYSCILEPTVTERFLIKKEEECYEDKCKIKGMNNYESTIKKNKDEKSTINENWHGVGYYIYDAIANWMVYHFHDTSALSPMRRSEITADFRSFRYNGGNIAPFLLGLRNQSPAAYESIVEAIRLVTPFFDDFILIPTQKGEKETVNLSWKQKGSDYPMQPYHFSDGTIRFICLATTLLQPQLPSTIVIDEPELGLHPYAIEILAELIQAASKKTQLIISTQSPALVDCFEPENVIVVNRKDGASSFARLNGDDLANWLKDYSLGELWRKNIVTGGPAHE